MKRTNENMARSKILKLRAKGRRAAFVRALNRVERLTYDVPTPSAGVGIFEAVLWHPGLHWRLTQIDVLNPIRYFSLRTNEVKELASTQRPFLDIENVRTQRNTVGLYDVDYVFTAYFELDGTAQHNVLAFEEMFQRYLRRGQIYHTPYFGMLPFTCDVMEPPAQYRTFEQGVDRPLGPMFYGWIFDDANKTSPEPVTFDARLVNGVVRIPSYATVLEGR